MEFYPVLKALQDSGQFDKLRSEIFAHPSIQEQFEVIQQRLINELSSSPLLLDVPLKMRQARLPQIFNSFRLAVRKTSVANDIHAILWNVINEIAPSIYSALEYAIVQPQTIAQSAIDPKNYPERNQDENGVTNVKPDLEPNPPALQMNQPDTFVAQNLPSTAQLEKSADNTANVAKAGKDDASQTKKGTKALKTKKRPRLVRLDSKAADKDDSHATSDDDYNPVQKKSSIGSFLGPQEPISKRVEIWWPLDKTWYKGIVTAFRARDKTHHIRYDDNETEWLDLLKERWRYEQ